MSTDERIKQILLKGNYAAFEDLEKAEAFARAHRVSIIEYLLSEALITKDLLGQAIAESLGVPYADLNSRPPARERVLKIPEDAAKKFRAAVFEENNETVTITSDFSTGEENMAGEFAKFFPGKKISLAYSLPDDIGAAFMHYRKPLAERFARIIDGKKRIAPEMLEEIFEDALADNTSDIHFEPRGGEVMVRFRIDGVLHEACRIPRQYYNNILNRVKVQSGLRIDDHFSAQDGSMRYEKGRISADMRISITPTVEGEKIMLRVLASYVRGLALSDLGLSSEHQKMTETAAQKPFGMILVAGPTGSGKTTTLYALLRMLNRAEVNITTIEDPVEYKMQGVNQIQVNPQTNLTFAKGLRSIVRQDPDIILVGEIRDTETAEIAVNAALTGHLMLSTFHANDAATAIPRLLDMGIEPFLLASTLEVVVAQRLVRRICEKCRYSFTMTKDELAHSAPAAADRCEGAEITLYRGKGCGACGQTGYRGRTAIFEFVRITPAMEDCILTRPPAQKVRAISRAEGMKSMFDDGIEKIKSGITTLEELMRVVAPEE